MFPITIYKIKEDFRNTVGEPFLPNALIKMQYYKSGIKLTTKLNNRIFRKFYTYRYINRLKTQSRPINSLRDWGNTAAKVWQAIIDGDYETPHY